MKVSHFLNQKICKSIGVKEVEGNKVGIELELEGRNVGLADVATKGWGRHHDGSLRGESIEYTTNGAVTIDTAKTLVESLFKKFLENKVVFNDSIRTSTHVHLNFSDKPVKHVLNFFTLFTMLEELLQFYSGEDRKGNVFCISTREAEGIVPLLVEGLTNGTFRIFAGDRFKYAACNLSTLYRFGTVEVRTMRGATSAEQVNNWIDILNDLYVYACTKMKSPAELIQNLSFFGANELLRQIFKPENLQRLLKEFPRTHELHYSLMEGARILQVFAYSFDEEFKEEIKEEDCALKGLAKQIPHGPHAGKSYSVYKPDGRVWNCAGARRGELFWAHDEACVDDNNLRWDGHVERFVYTDPRTGETSICLWKRHHDIPDEGFGVIFEDRPRDVRIQRIAVPRFLEEDGDEDHEEEPDWDEEEEDNDDED